MARRFRALTSLAYPSLDSMAIVRRAGGLSKLSPEDRAKVRIRRIHPGEYCDDIPSTSIAAALAGGKIEQVEEDEE